MKRLLIFAVFYLSFAACDAARSQMRIDSIIVRYSNLLRTSHSYSTDIGSGKVYNVHFDTSVVSGRWGYIAQSQSVTGDSIILTPTPKSQQQGKITISYDTTTKKIKEFRHHYLHGAGSYGEVSDLYFKDIFIDGFDSSSQMTLDSAMILSSKFGLTHAYATHSIGGVIDHGDWQIQVPVQQALVEILFYRSAPKSKVERFSTNTDSVFPNPASSMITITSLEPHEKIYIFDQLGREVHIPETGRTDESVSFNTSSLISGIYWLRTGGQTQKVVIQR